MQQDEKTKKFVCKAREVHGDRYDYSKVEYINAKTKITIICKTHGNFLQSPNGHLCNSGCVKCIDRTKRKSNIEEFIKKANDVHGDKYDYSKFNYINCKTKGIIICKIHGEFLQHASNHLLGKGCSKCACVYKYTTSEFIEKANDIHGNKYDYSKFNYIDSKTAGIIICKTHGEFLQSPVNHYASHGCINCIDRGKLLRYDTIQFIEKSIETHGDKYDYSKVDYVDSQTLVTIICKKHGEFLQGPSSHIGGCGCPKCAGVSLMTIEDFIEKSVDKHGDKYDYSKVEYINVKTKITIICKTHGEFIQTPDSHISGCGCPNCAQIQRNEKRLYTKDKFIQKSIEKHGDKYDYSNVDYVDLQTPVTIICKIHGDFIQLPINHYNGCGCQICGIIFSANSKRYTKDEFIQKSIEKHGDTYDYSKVDYVDSKTRVTIICKKHGEFIQVPQCHYSENGCPNCACKNYSKISISYLNFISKLNDIYITHAENEGEYEVEGYKIDGYCKSTNTLYEFHGDFWHGNPQIYNKDKINTKNGKTFGELYQTTLKKEHRIKELGYNLVIMWESEWMKINKSIKTLQKKIKRQLQ